MKRVLLINTNTEKNPYPIPPIGICLLAASIESKYNVQIPAQGQIQDVSVKVIIGTINFFLLFGGIVKILISRFQGILCRCNVAPVFYGIIFFII